MRTMYLLLVVLFLSVNCEDVSVKNSLVFGPGLSAGVNIPVRYFYIQAVDSQGKNFTHSPGQNTFAFNVKAEGVARTRVMVAVLDRNDGTFLARYRLWDSYSNLILEVLHDGKHVAQSPYIIKEMVYDEACICPEPNEEKWTNDMHCPANFEQIDSDLKEFPQIDLEHLIKTATKEYDVAICHYTIKDNLVYRKCYGTINDFKMFTDAWLLSLVKKVRIPDVEFFTNLGDWPLTTKRKSKLPIISWCGSNETFDLVWPTYDLTESSLETFGGRVTLDMQSVQGNTRPTWNEKLPKAFFRGRDSRQERLDLVIRHRKNVELFDIGLTHFFFFKHNEELHGPITPRVPFYDFFKYKYQISVDGTVAAYRFPYLLAGDSVIFKQDSKFYEHFYRHLSPMKHYVPVEKNLDDMEAKINWAIDNDEKAHQIAREGQKYARDNLLSDKLYCYTYTLLKEYAKRQVTEPTVREGMELLTHAKESRCHCKRKLKRKKTQTKHGEL